MKGGTLIQAVERYEAHEVHKLGALSIYALKVHITNVAPIISVVHVCPGLGSTPVKNLELLHFLGVVVWLMGKFPILGISTLLS